MIQQKKLIGIIFILLVLLFFRDTPYINVLVINRIWVLYLLLIFYLVPFRNITIVYVAIAIFLIAAYVLTILSFSIGAEILGVIIYVCFWILACHKLYRFFRSK